MSTIIMCSDKLRVEESEVVIVCLYVLYNITNKFTEEVDHDPYLVAYQEGAFLYPSYLEEA
jgi:hypothetical protein